MAAEEEKLVSLVAKYEELYDMANKNYSNNEVKENIWKQIANEMNISDTKCKDKWKKLRDNFRKALKARKTKSGDVAKKIRPWKLEDQMAFLIPHIIERSQISNLPGIEEETADSSEDDSSNISSPPPTPSTTSTTPLSMTNRKKRSSAPTPNVAHVLQSYIDSKKANSKKDVQNSPVRSFVLSMADASENLPVPLQIEVKSKLFNAVNDAERTALSYNQYGQTNRVEYSPYAQSFSQTSSQHSNNFQTTPPQQVTVPQTSPEPNNQYYSYIPSSCQQPEVQQFSQALTNLKNPASGPH